MTPKTFDLLVFDWDGTLFDSTACIVRSIQATARALGLPEPSKQDAAHVIGLGLTQALQIALPGLPAARAPEAVLAYREHYFATVHEVTLFDGVDRLLRDLKARGHRLAVATGKSRRGLDEALQQVGLVDVFDATRTAEETAGKPDPRMLMELMAELATPAPRTLMVGDTTHDLHLALNAGTPALAVSWGAHPAEDLAALAPLGLVHDVPSMVDWFQAHA